MARLRALSRGTKVVLVAGPLVILSLFLDWQDVKVDYGPAGVAELPQDGWDAWGLLLALLVIATLAVVVLRRLSEVELREDVPWDTVVLALGAASFAVAVLKSLRDDGSTWLSYGFVGLAALFAVGAYLCWEEARADSRSLVGRRRRGVSSAA